MIFVELAAKTTDRWLAALNAVDWECPETLEDVSLAKEAQPALQAAGSDRQIAGWPRWDDVKKELEMSR